jgi:predicted NAD/FAD-binding protein
MSTRKRIAIVGTGISGMVAAWMLNSDHDLEIIEARPRYGGHTRTITVDSRAGKGPVDTGFIVYNEKNYPNFTQLLGHLGVETAQSDMSFSVRDDSSGVEYCGSSLNAIFAQRLNLFRPSFHGMLKDIQRFYKDGKRFLEDPDLLMSLGDFVRKGKYGEPFVRLHLLPIGCAVWSAQPEDMLKMPMFFFARFFENHGFFDIGDRPQWRYIKGGSREYAKKLTASFSGRIRYHTQVERIRRFPDRVELTTEFGTEVFDAVILAVHSNQALQLLADPTPMEQYVLGAIPYRPNDVILHTDTRLLPRKRRAWAAWNYHVGGEEGPSARVTYNMNTLQNLQTPETWLVSLNRSSAIRPESIVSRATLYHPVFTQETLAAQRQVRYINGPERTWFCGAWCGYGFHEDGVKSALEVGKDFGKDLTQCILRSTRESLNTAASVLS